MFNHNRRAQRDGIATLGFEPLEGRCLLAGDVTGVVVNGTLTLTGDVLDNTIVIDQAGLAEQQFRVTGTGTTINGGAGPVIFNVVSKDINVNLDAGVDTVEFSGVNVFGDVTVRGGDGPNATTFSDGSTVAGRVNVINGDGPDTFTLSDGSRIDHSVRINNGTGGGTTTLDNSIILWDLTVRDTDGEDTLMIENVSLVNRFVKMFVGAGGSSTTVSDSGISGRLFVNGTGVVDTVVVTGSNISRGASARTTGYLYFTATDSRFDDNVTAFGADGIEATLESGSYFAFDAVLRGGAGAASTIVLSDATINRNLTIRTDGSADTAQLDNATVNGATRVGLGGGDDSLLIEQFGAGPGVSTFNGRFTFAGSTGDDTLSIGVPPLPGSHAVFNALATFNGGAGTNIRTLPQSATWGVVPIYRNI